jgi:hypothetical protein
MACGPVVGMDTPLPDVVARYLAAYNDKDVDSLVATVTDDVQFENLTNHGSATRVSGRAAFEALARQALGAFSTRRQVVVEAVVGADRIALLVRFEATVAADLPNGWKAGQEIALTGSTFFHLHGGRIARITDLS